MSARQLLAVVVVSAVVSSGVGFALGEATSPDVATAARVAAKSNLAEIRERVGEIKKMTKRNSNMLQRLQKLIGDTQLGAAWGLTGSFKVAWADIEKARDLAYFACGNDPSDLAVCNEIYDRPSAKP